MPPAERNITQHPSHSLSSSSRTFYRRATYRALWSSVAEEIAWTASLRRTLGRIQGRCWKKRNAKGRRGRVVPGMSMQPIMGGWDNVVFETRVRTHDGQLLLDNPRKHRSRPSSILYSCSYPCAPYFAGEDKQVDGKLTPENDSPYYLFGFASSLWPQLKPEFAALFKNKGWRHRTAKQRRSCFLVMSPGNSQSVLGVNQTALAGERQNMSESFRAGLGSRASGRE